MDFKRQDIVEYETVITKALLDAFQDGIEEAIRKAENGGAVIVEVVIPRNTWNKQETGEQEYPYYADITLEAARESSFPYVSLHKGSINTAAKAQMCPTAQTSDGVLRLWAKNIPDADMNATVALLKASGSAGEGSGSYVLPTATAERLGGVKIGENIDVTSDGTISSNGRLDPSQVATDEDIREMIENIRNETN